MRYPLIGCSLAALAAAPSPAQTAPPPAGYDQPAPAGAPRTDGGGQPGYGDPSGYGGQGGYGGHGGHGRGRPLTRDAALASVDRGFRVLDADGDGTVTRAEVDRYREARRAAMRARREGGGYDGYGAPGAPPPPDGGGDRPASPGPLLGNPGWFELADADHDGRVTPAEAQRGAMALFDRMDANHDGVVDPGERWQAMRGERRRGGPDGAAPPAPEPQ